MNPSVSFPRSVLFLLLLTLFLSSSFASHANEDDRFKNCEPFDCGKIKEISYPFQGRNQPEYCGHPGFVVDCESDQNSLMFDADAVSQKFLVLDINQKDRVLKIARMDFWDSYCPENFINITLNPTLFQYTPKDKNTILFSDCNNTLSNLFDYDCPGKNVSGWAYFVPDETYLGSPDFTWPECSISVVVPIMEEVVKGQVKSLDEVRKVFQRGFEVEWKIKDEDKCRECLNSRGRCGYNPSATDQDNHFMCFCPLDHQSDGLSCGPSQTTAPVYSANGLDPEKSQSNVTNLKLKVVIGVFGGGSVLLLVCIMTCRLRCMKSIKSWTKKTKNDQDLEAFIRSYGHLAAKRYRFLDVKKMTKSFKVKLGQGGFGEVFRGKLIDGRLVAVKILNASKGNGEEFMNEVASISRTSHVNIVTLLGFCLEGRRRALIYEFMPNGSLEKYTYKDNPLQTTPHLEWEKLLQISIGIARGLEYLHRGCNTKILHLDIKPHNILLDEDFCPKIADFGLAKLCPRKDSIISMADARGTIGYVAPEVFSRNFGGVSSKSDVYSYGMMILEMVGGRKNVKVGVSHTSEIYFPDWIYKHLELGSTLQMWEDMTSEENKMARKMIMVGLWCIQTKPSDRPSMSRVIEMLEGSLEALHLPPNPCMFSPRSPEKLPSNGLLEESSTTSVL